MKPPAPVLRQRPTIHVEAPAVARGKLHPALRERSNAQLRPLQIHEHPNRSLDLALNLSRMIRYRSAWSSWVPWLK